MRSRVLVRLVFHVKFNKTSAVMAGFKRAVERVETFTSEGYNTRSAYNHIFYCENDSFRPLRLTVRLFSLGSCIFKADFKILFRNFAGYLRY